MSNLNPGGSRSSGPRAFTPQQVARACEKGKIPDVDRASGSIATGSRHAQQNFQPMPHQHSREQQRRLRQQQRKATRDV
jgi:hypothetical protein